jgi:hypothetical protein
MRDDRKLSNCGSHGLKENGVSPLLRHLPVSPGTTWTDRIRRDPDPQKRSVWTWKSLIRLAIWAVVLRRIVSNGPRELHYVVSSALQIHWITVP